MGQTPPADRAVSLDEAIAIAIGLQQNEQWVAAGAIYRQILELAPDYPDAVHYSGVLAHQEGRSEDALRLIERSLELQPDRADWHSNLAIVLRDRLQLDAAIAACRRAIALDAAHANAHNNLGALLKAQGRIPDAEAAYRAAIRANPAHSDAYTNLGILLNGQRRIPEAVACFCKLITLRPKHPEARKLLALAHCTLGEFDQAIGVLEEWLGEEPDHPVALHLLAACSGRNVPSRASDAFIETTFDSFAGSFDAKLATLLYRAPALVTAMLDDLDRPPSKDLDVLDAGCGTGLCGPLLAPHARRLVGVDLSARMLAQAEARHAYDELVKGELTAFLGACTAAFDVIVSADTLVYFGSLADVVAAAEGALRPGGRFIFTVEEWSNAGPDAEYVLRPHGRYGHTRQYLDRVLTEARFQPEIVGAELRLEGGSPVAGLVVRATKPMAATEDAGHGSARTDHR
jgi:predicted TPR repeat methyltransferase